MKASRPLVTWGPTILFNVVLPVVTYQILRDQGVGSVAALTLITVWPVAEIGLFYALHRRIDEFGVMALVFMGLGIVSALAFNSAHLAVVKDSALTGLFGVAVLASLAMSRPLMFYMGRKFATNGTPEGIAYWNGLWQYPSFRHSQRVISAVWGVAFLVEAGVRIALSYPLSTSAMVLVNSVLPFAFIAVLVVWTFNYGRRVKAAALASALASAALTAAVR